MEKVEEEQVEQIEEQEENLAENQPEEEEKEVAEEESEEENEETEDESEDEESEEEESEEESDNEKQEDSESDDKTTTKKKAKKRGRPKKEKKAEEDSVEDDELDDKHKTTILETEEKPKKRGPGRPKKEETPAKKKAGRPKKKKTEEDEPEEKPKKRGPGRPKKKKDAAPKKKAGRPKKKKSEETDKTSKKTKRSNPNPLLEIMDNFKDDKNSDDDDTTDDMSDFMTAPMTGTDIMMDEDTDIELMSNSDLDVEEIIKIDNTDSEELEAELEKERGISEKQQMKEDVAEMEKKETKCPECGSTRLINDHERGEVVCGTCGLVIDDNLVDMGPEWRAFDHEQRDKRTRVGAPITYTIHDKGLSTMIDWRNKDIYGRDIPARNRAQWYRLRKWQRKIRISGATERNLAFALSELDRDSSRLGLPRSVRESASVVYRNAVENKLIRGRSIEGVVAASLYAACRRCQVPRTLDEIAEVSRVSKKEVGRTYRFLTRELHIRLPPTSPIDYVPRFASELNLSGVVQSKAIEIINEAMQNGLTSGRGPTGVAAAALYIASVILGERKTQRDVADIAGVTEVTIRNRYKELTEQLEMGVAL